MTTQCMPSHGEQHVCRAPDFETTKLFQSFSDVLENEGFYLRVIDGFGENRPAGKSGLDILRALAASESERDATGREDIRDRPGHLSPREVAIQQSAIERFAGLGCRNGLAHIHEWPDHLPAKFLDEHFHGRADQRLVFYDHDPY